MITVVPRPLSVLLRLARWALLWRWKQAEQASEQRPSSDSPQLRPEVLVHRLCLLSPQLAPCVGFCESFIRDRKKRRQVCVCPHWPRVKLSWHAGMAAGGEEQEGGWWPPSTDRKRENTRGGVRLLKSFLQRDRLLSPSGSLPPQTTAGELLWRDPATQERQTNRDYTSPGVGFWNFKAHLHWPSSSNKATPTPANPCKPSEQFYSLVKYMCLGAIFVNPPQGPGVWIQRHFLLRNHNYSLVLGWGVL